MKKILLPSLLLAVWLNGTAQNTGLKTKAVSETEVATSQPQSEIAIIPEPVKLVQQQGYFTLPKNIHIEAVRSGELKQSVSFLKERLRKSTGYTVNVSSSASSTAAIKLVLISKEDKVIGAEGYHLSVTPKLVTITANKPAGIFYGVQTLLQLLPKDIESKEEVKGINWQAPCVEITDYPRFGWRGLLFDVARHFFTKEEVKQYIDAMVRYKYNLLHLHLTDNDGWRIEIKGLPKLTEVGAWNVKREGNYGNFIPPTPDEPRDYGGFYTQEDLKELVAYAKERFVDIMPEVDFPGHSLAAVASYPELSCTPDAVNYKVRSGERLMYRNPGEERKALVDNTLCPANEKVYEFIDKVISQVAEIFPFEYIHTGGDEAPYNFWEISPQVKELMQREGLKTMAEVQGYFERRVEKIVAKYGKKFMAWDEVLEGGVSPNAAIMAWRDVKYGVEATKAKHEVVMTPTRYTYLDYMQGDPIIEPKVYAFLHLNRAYEYNPVPEGVDSKYVKGGQGNLWTEQVYNIRQAEYMTWPRGFAIIESLWSPPEKKDWKHFITRTEKHFERLDASETKYSPAMYDPIFKISRTTEGRLRVRLESQIEGIDFYYSFDHSLPDHFYPKYEKPLIIPIDCGVLRVIAYKGKKPVGRMMHMPAEEMNRRAPIKKTKE